MTLLLRRRPLPPLTLAFLLSLSLSLSACGFGSEYAGEVLHPDGGEVTGMEAAPANLPTAGQGDQTNDDGAATPPLASGSDASEAGTGQGITNGIGKAVALEPAEEANVPATPPTVDCSDRCVLVLEGDSLTFGFTDWVCRSLANADCVNSGVSGARVDQMSDHAPNDVDPLASDSTNDVLVLWGGTNDLWQKFHSEDPTVNAEGTYLSIIDYVAERRANGWDVIAIMTLPPANPETVQGAEHLNGLIRQNLAEADIIIDVARDPGLADPFDPVLRAPDGVHYKDPGREIVVEQNILPELREIGLS